jgi:hypothetical protein
MNDLPRRRMCLAPLAAWSAPGLLGLAGCTSLFAPRSIVLGEAELQALLARRFPMQRSVLEVFELQLDQPSLRLDAAARRLSTELGLSGSDRRTGRTLQGRLGVDYALRLEAADSSLRLVQPRVTRLQIDPGTGPAGGLRLNENTQRIAVALIERALDDLVLYRVPAERLERLRALGLQPGSVEVTPAGVEITIERVA